MGAPPSLELRRRAHFFDGVSPRASAVDWGFGYWGHRLRRYGAPNEDPRFHHGVVETTRYFREQVLRKRPYLKLEWIESVLRAPARRSVQPDGRVRHWGYIPALGRWLRVVTLEDGETVHNAFPDRDFEEPES